ncbi:molybdate ABC transporter substrate-binding protein [Algihabitans albus]|uniref:molybdate ABC transporter substrate-binding protein n=1 Tax=Algihabitans albus TaxID=2164067 RepID=UPI000E5D10F2|nr:molybdate ABC transporter substrate-binding protein [Algihabitans albus]
MLKRLLPLMTGTLLMTTAALPASADAVKLQAAGSLRAAMTDIAAAYTESSGKAVQAAFGPSGLLRERIEGGEASHVFASANMRHPRILESQGIGGPVVLFARNRLCVLTQPALGVTPETLLETILSAEVRLGTSTPKADPSGDYAWQLFEKAEELQAGSFAALDAKALQLTGGPDSAKAPEGRNPYAWVMAEQQADLFLTYCTNAMLAKADKPDLEIVAIPDALAVGADYGLTLISPENAAAAQLALFILSPAGQEILESYGFTAVGLP